MTRSALGMSTLPGRYFVDTAVFQQEWKRIFYRNWLCLGREAQIREPGQFVTVQAGEENLILVRDEAGEARAFYNVCRHRGTQICQGAGQVSRSLQCPYHAWTYGLDGRLLGAPTMQDVPDFDREQYPLKSVATAVWEGFLFVNLAAEPEPFAQAYAPILRKFSQWQMSRLEQTRQIIYDVAANWKIIFHNYSECYHCPGVHPRLNELTPYRNASNDLDEGAILGGPMQLAQAGSMTMSGRLCAAPLADFSGDARQLVWYYTLFPTMFLSLFPDYAMTHRLEPMAPDRTRVICEWFFAPEAARQSNFNPQDAIDFWDMTNREDWQVCEWTQAGVQSRAYTPGPYSDLESNLAAFDREYLRQLGHL
ncbi:MAG TPA: aromatic ring-hydroxylating dioxygenase subunit alpha [Anaerolineae bacterium]|nr:aromatic ring-hydroxylating dioxygenase subunit alpha [Anaerolineae bacterium]